MSYYISKIVPQTQVSELRPKVEAALKEEGFGILTEIDIQAVMKARLDKDYAPHIILGACNPGYADKVLGIDPHMSTLLPCNVTLRETDSGDVEVSAIAPLVAMAPVGNKAIEQPAQEINDKLIRVINRL